MRLKPMEFIAPDDETMNSRLHVLEVLVQVPWKGPDTLFDGNHLFGASGDKMKQRYKTATLMANH